MTADAMSTPSVPDFLRAKSDRAVKRELRGILQSYHHYWDILAELLQNARDAIDKRRQLQLANGQTAEDGKIHIVVDATCRAVEVVDNGTGIESSFIEEVLSPGGGDKSGSDDQIGEKGVGLTYVAFSGDEFSLSTSRGSEQASCTLTGGASWVAADDQSVYPPKFGLESGAMAPHGFEGTSFTSVRVAGIRKGSSTDLFSLTNDELKWVLRTRTAVGDTRALLRGQALPPVQVTYSWTSADGEHMSGPVELGYPSLAAPSALKIEDVNSNLVGKNEVASRAYLSGKTVVGLKTVDHGSDKIRVYGVMLPGNKAIEEIAKANHLDPEPDDQNPLVHSGIFVVTKSMPTGVVIEPAAKGAYPAYYKRCIFLVESDRIDFDLGRKSMHWQHRRKLQDAVAELFIQFERVAKFQTNSDSSPIPTPPETSAERKHRIKKMWDEVEKRHPLGWPGIVFDKVPTNQEAAVAAIFHELLGAGKITGFRPLAAGYATQYDLLAHYVKGGELLQVIIEFKDKLESVLSDFRDGDKSVGDVDLLVCWDASQHKIAQVGLTITVEPDPPYDGVTHQLHLPSEINQEPIPVIVLKSLLEKTQGG